MPTKKTDQWAEMGATLPADDQSLLRQFRADYLAAARLHHATWTGGPSPKILAELIRQGWRKRPD